jgi:hypothetical protein
VAGRPQTTNQRIAVVAKTPAVAKAEGTNMSDQKQEFEMPQGISVIVEMRPDRIFGGLAEEDAKNASERCYRTCSWYFANDFLDRVNEIVAKERAGKARLKEVKATFELDEKAYRQVDRILDSVTSAFRAL